LSSQKTSAETHTSKTKAQTNPEGSAVSGAFASEVVVPSDHPSLAGHFPGRPVVPAVVMLDAVHSALSGILQSRARPALRSIRVAKFLQPVLPGQRIEVRFKLDATQSRATFEGWRGTVRVFEGSFIL